MSGIIVDCYIDLQGKICPVNTKDQKYLDLYKESKGNIHLVIHKLK